MYYIDKLYKNSISVKDTTDDVSVKVHPDDLVRHIKTTKTHVYGIYVGTGEGYVILTSGLKPNSRECNTYTLNNLISNLMYDSNCNPVYDNNLEELACYLLEIKEGYSVRVSCPELNTEYMYKKKNNSEYSWFVSYIKEKKVSHTLVSSYKMAVDILKLYCSGKSIFVSLE